MKEFILMAFVLIVSCLFALLALYVIECYYLNNKDDEYSDDEPDECCKR